MTSRDEDQELFNVMDALAESVLSLSDEELLEELPVVEKTAALNAMFREAIMKMAEKQIEERDPHAPPPPPPVEQRVARAVNAAVFLRAVAPALLLPRY